MQLVSLLSFILPVLISNISFIKFLTSFDDSLLSDRTIQERRDFLHDLKTEMPKGTKWADELIENIEETVINGGFDKARVEQWPEDKVLQRDYQKFEYGRQESGKADRLASWSYESIAIICTYAKDDHSSPG
jgi:hypothetical protein